MEEKRKRARAIILVDESIVVMYREMEDRIFYAFPGGGVEGNESLEECVVREVKEEFGINVQPIKKLYEYEREYDHEYFYLCEWVSGEFGTGQGEEFQEGHTGGIYRPTFMKISDRSRESCMTITFAARGRWSPYLPNITTAPR